MNRFYTVAFLDRCRDLIRAHGFAATLRAVHDFEGLLR